MSAIRTSHLPLDLARASRMCCPVREISFTAGDKVHGPLYFEAESFASCRTHSRHGLGWVPTRSLDDSFSTPRSFIARRTRMPDTPPLIRAPRQATRSAAAESLLLRSVDHRTACRRRSTRRGRFDGEIAASGCRVHVIFACVDGMQALRNGPSHQRSMSARRRSSESARFVGFTNPSVPRSRPD